jgi:hypothetical protein
MMTLRDTIDEIPAFQVFHEALDAVQEGYPGWCGTDLEIVGANLAKTEKSFLLAHEPDGPWLAVCPLDDGAFAAMGSPAADWAERQRWEPIMRLRGHKAEDGTWWLAEVEVTE